MTLYKCYFSFLAGLLFTLSPAHGQELPLWEIGIGTGALYLPYYRGADQSRAHGIPFPYIVYRGEYLSIDEGGAHGNIFRSQDVILELSLAGGVPVTSSNDSPRFNMPDLDPTAELGPSLDARFWHTNDDRRALWLRLPVRAAISINLEKLDHQGWTFSPYIEYIVESPHPGNWKLGLAWGPLYADNNYHDYFYEVISRYASPSRPEYHANGGYSGNRVTLTLQKNIDDLWIGAFIRYDNLNNAEFLESPLVNSHSYLATGIGFTWVFSKSDTLVNVVDD